MNNSLYNNTTSSKSAVNSKSSVVINGSRSKSASVVSKSASNSSKASAPAKKITPHVASLKDRTSIHDVNATVRDLKITDRKGNVITAKLQEPGYQTMLDIDDARSVGTMIGGHPYMKTTSANYFEHLFNTFHNVEINNQPTPMSWKFANKHHEAFRWLMDQANSFLRAKYNAD